MTEKLIVHRLSPEMYEKLEAKVTSLTSHVPKTELEAGFSLGVQHVLKVLRTDLTVGDGT